MPRLAGAALVILLATTGPVLAQPRSFCGGSLMLNSLYSVVSATPRGGATVDYIGQLQNVDGSRRRLTATLDAIATVGSTRVTTVVGAVAIASYEQKGPILLRATVPAMNGAGAPTAAAMRQAIGFTCTFN